MFLYELAFDHRCVGHDLRTAMLENKGATFAADWISDTARTTQRNAAKIERQTNPMILRTVSFDHVNLVSAAKSPETPGTQQVNAGPERHCYQPCAEFRGLGVNLTAWIADQPRLMPMRIQPVNLQTSTILLAAPAAATLYVENIHVESMTCTVTGTVYAAVARFSRM